MESLYFRENGSRGEAAIVFIHGGGISGGLWQPALQALPEFHCLAPDLPGFGQSAHLTPFSAENAAEGLAELIQCNVPAGRAAVVAFSIGAVVAVELCNRYPDLVTRAFLSGPTPRFSRFVTTMMNAVARPLLSLIGTKQRSRFMARSLGLTEDQMEAFQQDLEGLTIDLFIQVNEVVAEQNDPRPNGLPALIFAGEKEIGAVKRRARELTKYYENGRGYIVRSLGHVWCLENPELFHQAIRAWMMDSELGEDFLPL